MYYFVSFGSAILPGARTASATRGGGTLDYLKRIHDLDAAVHEVLVPVGSPLVGRAIMDVQSEFEVRIIASRYAGKTLVSTPVEAPIAAPAILAVIAQPEELDDFLAKGRLIYLSQPQEESQAQ